MYSLTSFKIEEMVEAGQALRELESKSSSINDVASNVAEWFYDSFRNPITKESEFAISRLFKTDSYQNLTPNLQDFAQKIAGDNKLKSETKCLVLLGTRGDEQGWNSNTTSNGHKAIPLVNEDFVANIPMITGLIHQLGLKLSDVISPDLSIISKNKTDYNVFYVSNALNSPLIPAQEDFVIPYKIKSVLGFGTLLPTGDLYSVILFSKEKIEENVAHLFQPLALNIKLTLLPFLKE